jgi:hypothetical protein
VLVAGGKTATTPTRATVCSLLTDVHLTFTLYSRGGRAAGQLPIATTVRAALPRKMEASLG